MALDKLTPFLEKIRFDPGRCWLWEGAKTPLGYGHMSIRKNGKRVDAYSHRVSWETFCGPVPDGLEVCHRCDTPSCMRPDHLFLGTHRDNMRDSVQKGRWNRPKGEAHYRAKLTDGIVRNIRANIGLRSITDMARDVGVSYMAVWYICRRKTWTHIQ